MINSDAPPPVIPPRLEPDVIAGHATPGHFDELRGRLACPSAPTVSPSSVASDAELSEVWAQFFQNIEATTSQDLDHQAASLGRQIRDNGVTYNVYADEGGPQRPWALDLFPLLVEPQSWHNIEVGVIQRMRLLEQIMTDVYGPQDLLSRGLIPSALVHGHPGYQRPMHGVQPVGGTFLHIAAFDLARGPQGDWRVIAQRCQAPAGLGYLLENRLAISSQFPQAFQALQVQRLASTYRALVENLKRMSPAGAASHVALLTPGPYNESYFEHAYLARYLGLSLVEGSDLVVREEHLYLKTLKGLVPVHGLLKRLDDDYLDPLELRHDSTLGIPGLIQAIRAGNVLVANTPGSAFLEAPALLGFLPGLARVLLGQELQLPSVPTWWCGEHAAMQQALPRLASCVIKPTYPSASGHGQIHGVRGSSLSALELIQWRSKIAQDGENYTVQAFLPLSQMPTWQSPSPPHDKHQVQLPMRSVVMRVFVVCDGPQSWRVLPGGLARVSGDTATIASMQRGGSSADVWALTRGEVDKTTLLRPHMTPASLTQRQRMVTSRVAENLFWLGRYTERAENAIRLGRLTLECINGEEQTCQSLLAWLRQMAVANTLVRPAEADAGKTRLSFERALIANLEADQGAFSVGYYLRALKVAASTVRERLSQEHWRIIVRAEEAFFASCADHSIRHEHAYVQALQVLKNSSDHMAAITGAQTDRMTRDDGWRLLSIGRHIERLGFLSNALFCGFETGSVHTDGGFDAMLALFDSTITFLAQFQQSRDLPALIDLLVLDRDNPRSLAWVSQTLRGRLAKLAGAESGQLSELARRVPDPGEHGLAQLCAMLHPSVSLENTESTDTSYFFTLNDLMLRCSKASCEVSEAVSTTYFTHATENSASAGAP